MRLERTVGHSGWEVRGSSEEATSGPDLGEEDSALKVCLYRGSRQAGSRRVGGRARGASP